MTPRFNPLIAEVGFHCNLRNARNDRSVEQDVASMTKYPARISLRGRRVKNQ